MEKLNIIKTLEELKVLKAYLANPDNEFLAYDTETTGVEKDSTIIGFSVAGSTEEAFYVILSYWDVESQRLIDLETKAEATEVLTLLLNKQLIMHNAPFDCFMTKNNFGVELMPRVHTDTMILGHLLDENRSNGLKELGVSLFGESAKKEQDDMKESVHKNGGVLTKQNYELYKADADLIALYGAKDTILTLKLFYELVPKLYEEGLDTFFYDEESMPLLRGPTYELNTVGLRVDPERLQTLKKTLEAEIAEAKSFITKEIFDHVKVKYPGTGKTNHFNFDSGQQLAWLLFFQLKNDFNNLTDGGRELCKALQLKLPYTPKARRDFIQACVQSADRVYKEAEFNPKTQKMGRPKKVGEPWKYIAVGKETLTKLSGKYKWVQKLLEYKKNLKLLNTYVEGIESRARYNIIRPSFLQHGTTSGRYSCKNPNFQNLPRDDKRIKDCIVSRPGKVFVGSDYSQLEARVFASFSEDPRLLAAFDGKSDFYSVIGMDVFDKHDCTPQKEGSPDAFGVKYKNLRQIAKVIALSATYGTTAPKMAPLIDKTIEEAQQVIDDYFDSFPKVKQFMNSSHAEVKANGRVLNLFGRPRRMPDALKITEVYGNTAHERLPYEARNVLNLSVNHKTQSTGASIMNRAAIAIWKRLEAENIQDVKIVLQIHDELILECPEDKAEYVVSLMRDCMENTVQLPGVRLEADPKIAHDLAKLK